MSILEICLENTTFTGVPNINLRIMLYNEIKVFSANCQGLQNKQKTADVLSYFREKNINILCLKDTHWIDNDLQDIKNLWSGDCYIHGSKTNARGVAILFGNNFECEVLSTRKDTEGNYLSLILKLSSMTINFVSIYAPNRDTPFFFSKLQEVIQDNDSEYCIICGDYNLVMNPIIYTDGYKHINNPKVRLATLKIIDDFGLVDIYRHMHPNTP